MEQRANVSFTRAIKISILQILGRFEGQAEFNTKLLKRKDVICALIKTTEKQINVVLGATSQSTTNTVLIAVAIVSNYCLTLYIYF